MSEMKTPKHVQRHLDYARSHGLQIEEDRSGDRMFTTDAYRVSHPEAERLGRNFEVWIYVMRYERDGSQRTAFHLYRGGQLGKNLRKHTIKISGREAHNWMTELAR